MGAVSELLVSRVAPRGVGGQGPGFGFGDWGFGIGDFGIRGLDICRTLV